MGQQYAAQPDRTTKFINDPVITACVNRVAQNLVRPEIAGGPAYANQAG
jgi:hypothetical protein